MKKLGASASFNPNHLNDEDKRGIEQTLSDSKPLNAIQTQTPPDEEDIPDEGDENEKDSESLNCALVSGYQSQKAPIFNMLKLIVVLLSFYVSMFLCLTEA